MVRKKVTVSLSSKCLQLIDHYAKTTGFESRSRVIEESIFAINEFLGHRQRYTQTVQQAKENPSQEQTMNSLFDLMGVLSRFGGILDRFERFGNIPQKQTDTEA